jgi:5-methylcytosine-specific restriction enzyme A
MPRAPRSCAEASCPDVAVPDGRGRCAAHRRPAWSGSDRRDRLPADWAERRGAVLARDGGRCRIALPGCIGTAVEVDHIVPGDDHELINLRAACVPCHRIKSASEGGAASAVSRRTGAAEARAEARADAGAPAASRATSPRRRPGAEPDWTPMPPIRVRTR